MSEHATELLFVLSALCLFGSASLFIGYLILRVCVLLGAPRWWIDGKSDQWDNWRN